MKRPLSPRRDYLMRCAEKQLLPVPAINRALKIDPNTEEESSTWGDARHSHEADQGKTNAVAAKGKALIPSGVREPGTP